MDSVDYGNDILASTNTYQHNRRVVPKLSVELGMVLEEASSGFCGEVIAAAKNTVTLEDRHGHQRIFPYSSAGFLLEGRLVTLVAVLPEASKQVGAKRTASGSVAVANSPARVAHASRIYVEGIQDAALIERVWGDDLRIEGIVVEPLHGIDDLPAAVSHFRANKDQRLGVLVDHLVPGTKESLIVAEITDANVLILGHPYVDIWQAIKPSSIGISAWPQVPRSIPWKEGICRALNVADVAEMWRRVFGAVRSYTDLETPLIHAVEQLIDFVTTSP